MQFYDGLRWVPWYIEALVHPWFRWLIKQRIAVEAAFRASMASCSCYCSRPVSDWLVGRLPPLFLGDGAKPLGIYIRDSKKHDNIHIPDSWMQYMMSNVELSDIPRIPRFQASLADPQTAQQPPADPPRFSAFGACSASSNGGVAFPYPSCQPQSCLGLVLSQEYWCCMICSVIYLYIQTAVSNSKI